jgi:hypothetical protein
MPLKSLLLMIKEVLLKQYKLSIVKTMYRIKLYEAIGIENLVRYTPALVELPLAITHTH